MTGAPISQSFDAKLHRSVWSKISREGLESIPRVHQSFLNVAPSSNALEMEVIYSGLPAVPQVASDTVRTPQVSFEISPKVIYRHNEYRYQYIYTKVAADDDQYGVITDVVGTMGEGAGYRMEVVAADLFNSGEDATAYATWDGKAIFAADHELVGSTSTYSNITAAGGPTYATLHVIASYFRRVMNDQGFWTPVEIESIQVAPEMAPLWRQLLTSPSAYSTLVDNSSTTAAAAYTATANTNSGITNVSSTLGLTADKIVENVYLATLEDTIVVGRGKKLNMYVREAPNTDTYNLDDPKAIAHRIQMRFSVGATDARRVLLVPGS
jgi:hypothetical protein